MAKNVNELKIKIAVLVSFIIMIALNFIANTKLLGGTDTAQVSDSYPNLFAPAGITFSIWGVIYLFLLIFTIYQLFAKNNQRILHIDKYYIATCILNAAWILCWGYKLIPITVILIIALLYCLVKILLYSEKHQMPLPQRALIKIAFGIYAGWITVATIANITVLLVFLKWNGFGIPEQTWMIAVLIVGAVIACKNVISLRNPYYILAVIWGYTGIWIKHTDPNYFNSAYPKIITTDLICIAVMAAFFLISLVRCYQHRHFYLKG